MAFLLSVVRPLVYLSIPVFLLRTAANASPTGRYYVRFGLYVFSITFTAVCAAFVAAGMTLIGRTYDVNNLVAGSFYVFGKWMLGIRIEVEGEEYLQTRPAVFMGNHQSMLDVLVLGRCASVKSLAAFHTNFAPLTLFSPRRLIPKGSSIMAKKELRWTPLGPFMILSGTVFVDRGNSASAMRSIQIAGEEMRIRRTSLWLYPEGTRTSQEEPNMITFKKGGFHLAIQAGIPIVPVVTENYWRLYHPGVFESGVIKVRGA